MIDYLLRAYELNPYDPYICVMITQAFFGRSMNRQSDNRNYQIAQVSREFLSLRRYSHTLCLVAVFLNLPLQSILPTLPFSLTLCLTTLHIVQAPFHRPWL
jgi:hypothetical protein